MNSNPEPIILVFEGMNRESLEEVGREIRRIFKGTRFEGHGLITSRMVHGIDNANADKLDEIIHQLKELNKVLKNG